MTAVDERSKAAEIDAAERSLTEAEQKSGKDSQGLLDAIHHLAWLYQRDGLYAKAELLFRRALDIASQGGQQKEIVAALSRLGLIYRYEGKLDDAESIYLRSVAAAEQVEDSARLRAERLCCLSGLYVEKRQPEQALELLKKATAAYQAAFGQHSVYSRLCCIAMAAVCRSAGKLGEADEYFERSRDVSAAEPESCGDQRAVLELAQNYYAQGRLDEVQALLAHTIYSDEQALWPDHPQVAKALQERGELFRAQGRFADAESCFQRALDIRGRILGPKHPEVAESAMSLATMYLSQNRCGEAEPPLKIALRTRVWAFGVEHAGVAACIETYANLLKRTKRGAIAGMLEARARDIRTRLVWNADQASAQSSSLPKLPN